MKFIQSILIVLINVTILFPAHGQTTEENPKKIYKLNYKAEIPLTLGMFALNIYGFNLLGKKPVLTVDKINSLDQNDIWAFDRHVFSQSYPPPSGIYDIANIGLWTSYAAPAFLLFDKEIRAEWKDIYLMYLESQSINLNIYLWGGPVFTKRIRPLVYIDNESPEYKLGKETTDSFFSGHVAMVSGATFFMAKVLCDYHPELGSKKWLVYGAALMPPAIMSYWRYRGFMHFPTDLLLGAAVGAAVGISIPQIHNITKKANADFSVVPFAGKYSGLAVSLVF